MNFIFYELLQIALGNREMFSNILSAEKWEEAYDLARKQGVVGICFAGITKLIANAHQEQVPIENDDEEFDESWLETVNLPEELYYTWMRQAIDIQKRNKLMNERCVELQKMLSDAGFRSCILKGQGIARLYKSHANEKLETRTLDFELASYRQSGDIDIWVDAPRDKIISYVKSKCDREIDICSLHTEFHIFNDCDVEVHFIPSGSSTPIFGRRLSKYFAKQKDIQMKHNVLLLNQEQIIAPNNLFNSIFILHHIFRHCIFEGIGLRHIMDYYFVLKQKLSGKEQETIISQLKQFGLYKFACAISYVMEETFGYSDCFIPANKKYGNIVLRAIMDEGNFGKYDINRDKDKWKYPLYRFVFHTIRQIKFLPIAPMTILWNPIARCKEFLWRYFKGHIR